MQISDEMIEAAYAAFQANQKAIIPKGTHVQYEKNLMRHVLTAAERIRSALVTPTDAGKVEGDAVDWPVGEAEVVMFDPRRDPIPKREPYKIIDASLWFMDRAGIGERLYTKAQVEEIVRATLASPPLPTPEASPAPVEPTLGDMKARSCLWNFAIEACAQLIEKNIIQDTSAGKVLVPRQDGNRDGLHYAAAIRALVATGGSDNG